MANIMGKFAEQSDIVVTGQVLSSNNNQTVLNVALADANHLQGSNVTFQPSGLLTTVNAPIPSVAQALQGTVGAALGGIGQGGTASEQPGGGGVPCFAYSVGVQTAIGGEKPIGEIVTAQDQVLAFDSLGNRIACFVIGKHEHWVTDSLLVKFADGRETHTNALHPYWVEGEIFEPIFKLDWVWHFDGEWMKIYITEKIALTEPVMLYNLEVDVYKTYFANGDAVHNLKPLDNSEQF